MCSSTGSRPARKTLLLDAFVDDRLQRRDDAAIAVLQARHGADVRAVVDVLVHHEAYELRMLGVVVEGVPDVLLQRLVGAHRLVVRRGLARADLGVRLLEHRAIQLLFAAEVVVDHPLRRIDLVGDLVDTRAGESLVGELLRGDIEDIEPYLLRFAVPIPWLLFSCSRQGLAPGEGLEWRHCGAIAASNLGLKQP